MVSEHPTVTEGIFLISVIFHKEDSKIVPREMEVPLVVVLQVKDQLASKAILMEDSIQEVFLEDQVQDRIQVALSISSASLEDQVSKEILDLVVSTRLEHLGNQDSQVSLDSLDSQLNLANLLSRPKHFNQLSRLNLLNLPNLHKLATQYQGQLKPLRYSKVDQPHLLVVVCKRFPDKE